MAEEAQGQLGQYTNNPLTAISIWMDREVYCDEPTFSKFKSKIRSNLITITTFFEVGANSENKFHLNVTHLFILQIKYFSAYTA